MPASRAGEAFLGLPRSLLIDMFLSFAALMNDFYKLTPTTTVPGPYVFPSAVLNPKSLSTVSQNLFPSNLPNYASWLRSGMLAASSRSVSLEKY